MAKNTNELDHSVGFIMGMTYRKLSNLLFQRLKPFDITPEQWSVLYHISNTDGLIQKEIAELSGKDRPTTTRILDHLQGKGLVRKKTDDNDRRSFLVTITDQGKQLIEKTTPIERQVTAEIKNCMSEKEFELLLQLLFRIDRHVNKLID